MRKSFKKFQDDEWDDEWGNDDDDFRRKDKKMKNRRDKKRQKINDKLTRFGDDEEYGQK